MGRFRIFEGRGNRLANRLAMKRASKMSRITSTYVGPARGRMAVPSVDMEPTWE